jgi:hypothetical protein
LRSKVADSRSPGCQPAPVRGGSVSKSVIASSSW